MQNINYLYNRNLNLAEMVLSIFNPDTDLALANGKGNYTPTEGVRQMISDLSLLPVWYVESGSYVLTDTLSGKSFLEDMTQRFNLDVHLLTFSELSSLFSQKVIAKSVPLFPNRKLSVVNPADSATEPFEIRPWGWNTSFRNMLIRAGFNPQYLPTDAQLDSHRQLSQRGVVQSVLLQFQGQPGFCGISYNVERITDCEEFYDYLKGKSGVVFKEPWSSSGKGLLWCRDSFNAKDKNWCQRVIETQGYVTISPIYNKVQDFAMEFFVGDEPNRVVSFLGYSLFTTDHKGFYKGNALLSNAEIVKVLTKYVPNFLLDKTLATIGSFLVEKGYKGHVGVDMMICQESDGMCIHPCVEINYRHTMGYVARVITDRFLAEGTQGRFMIQHFRTHEQLVTFVNDSQSKYLLRVKQGKVFSGFVPLVPVTHYSLNLAYIVVS